METLFKTFKVMLAIYSVMAIFEMVCNDSLDYLIFPISCLFLVVYEIYKFHDDLYAQYNPNEINGDFYTNKETGQTFTRTYTYTAKNAEKEAYKELIKYTDTGLNISIHQDKEETIK